MLGHSSCSLLLAKSQDTKIGQCLNTINYSRARCAGSMRASSAPQLLKGPGFGWEESFPLRSAHFWQQHFTSYSMHLCRAGESTQSVWLQGAGGTCSSATIAALLASFTGHQVAPHFCYSLLCSPPPLPKAYMSSLPPFCTNAFCFCPFPACYISFNHPGCFTSDRNVPCFSKHTRS